MWVVMVVVVIVVIVVSVGVVGIVVGVCSGGFRRDSSDCRECWCGWERHGHGHRQSAIGVKTDMLCGFISIAASFSL